MHATQFASYHSHRFDGRTDCLVGVLSGKETPQLDIPAEKGASHCGDFLVCVGLLVFTPHAGCGGFLVCHGGCVYRH